MSKAEAAILLVASEAREFRGLLRYCHDIAPLHWPIGFSRSARFGGGRRLICVANGPGFRLVEKALDAAAHENFDAVVSTGFCGGLDPALAIGDVVEATTVLDLAAGSRYPCGGQSSRKPTTVVSVDRVAESAREKTELRILTHGAAVEMEAAVVARFAARRGLPFSCIRAVSDPAGHSFEISFNHLRDGDGRFRKSRIVIEALKRPWRRIPGLLALDGNCRIAERRLGEFFANRNFAV